MKSAILLCLLTSAPMFVSAGVRDQETLILCHAKEASEIVVELWKPLKFDVPVHCIRSDLIAGNMLCASNGGWGLNSNSATLEVTNDWKTAHEYPAGKMTAIAGLRGIRFNAQYGEGVGSNLNYEWKFSLDRRTGKATWFARDGQKIGYSCEVQP